MLTTPVLRAVILVVVALGSAAAQAEVRRPPKALPPEAAARTCPELGEGFVRIPGSDSCIRLGGSVRVEYSRQSRGSAFYPDAQ